MDRYPRSLTHLERGIARSTGRGGGGREGRDRDRDRDRGGIDGAPLERFCSRTKLRAQAPFIG